MGDDESTVYIRVIQCDPFARPRSWRSQASGAPLSDRNVVLFGESGCTWTFAPTGIIDNVYRTEQSYIYVYQDLPRGVYK